MIKIKPLLVSLALLVHLSTLCHAQFADNFDKKELTGWQFFTGDGFITMDFTQRDGYAKIRVDATKDPYNVWYAITKRNIASSLNLNKLKGPGTELRVEARVRIYNPPHRVNIMVNTQKTTDFHHDLMEFEIQDNGWNVISMTTRDLDAVPGDSLFIQFNVTDFGYEKYQVDIDYIKADIINVKRAGPDRGLQIPYHPVIPDIATFSNHEPVKHDALINSDFPNVNLNDFHSTEKDGFARVLSVGGNQWAILRWDLEKYKDAVATGPGVLEITTQSVASGGNYIAAFGEQLGEEFPRVRVIEIFGGPTQWDQTNITYETFMENTPYAEVFNTQMIYDKQLDETPRAKNFITISQPVMQRLLNGTTKGLLIRPLGGVTANFYASEMKESELVPKLHFGL